MRCGWEEHSLGPGRTGGFLGRGAGQGNVEEERRIGRSQADPRDIYSQ